MCQRWLIGRYPIWLTGKDQYHRVKFSFWNSLLLYSEGESWQSRSMLMIFLFLDRSWKNTPICYDYCRNQMIRLWLSESITMNGQPTVSHPTNSNEQLVGKFHVEKLPNSAIGSHEETGSSAAQLPGLTPAGAAADESACASRFQMIRVDRNFAKGRWKVNDYEPPENTSASINLPVNPIESEPASSSNPNSFPTMPAASLSSTTASLTTLPPNVLTMLPGDPNAPSSTTLAPVSHRTSLNGADQSYSLSLFSLVSSSCPCLSTTPATISSQ